MASNKETGDENTNEFIAWRDRMNKTPELYHDYKRGSKLNKVRMADTLGFHGRGVFTDNKTISGLLEKLEIKLRKQGILDPIKPKSADKSGKKADPTESDPKQSKFEKEREHARHLEHDVCELRAERDDLRKEKKELKEEVTTLKQEVNNLKSQLRKFEVLDSALSGVGRLPR
ncbi:hypothetical protein [Photobacterium swingsii]|uniref:hypothetical protein n=1 Tax=Photobacterium swingsii TaxID=680026 RepID=UPI004068C948